MTHEDLLLYVRDLRILSLNTISYKHIYLGCSYCNIQCAVKLTLFKHVEVNVIRVGYNIIITSTGTSPNEYGAMVENYFRTQKCHKASKTKSIKF